MIGVTTRLRNFEIVSRPITAAVSGYSICDPAPTRKPEATSRRRRRLPRSGWDEGGAVWQAAWRPGRVLLQRGAARRDRARGCHHFATMPITTMSPMNEATLDVIRVTIRSKTTPATESTQDERIVTTPVEAALWISEAEDVSMTDMGEAIGAGTDSAASSVLNMPKTQVERANSTLHAIRAVFPAAGTCGTRPGLMGFEAVKAG
jgi:hypothetical protein